MFDDIIQKERKLSWYIEPFPKFFEMSAVDTQEIMDYVSEEIVKEIDREIVESVIKEANNE